VDSAQMRADKGEAQRATARKVAGSDDMDLQLLYFTSTSLSADGRSLALIGQEAGNPNLFRLDRETGSITQLTHNQDGWLRSYVYFDGTPYRGFGKASVSFDAQRNILYYLQGRELRAVDFNGEERVLALLPDDQVTAFTHVSADGKLVCVPTTDEAAFTEDAAWSEQRKGIDARVQRLGLVSYLRIFCTETGEQVRCEPVPQAWVTHVQFSPTDSSTILYNHEWPSDCGVRRVWLWDGRKHTRLRQEGEGRSRHDWTCHEMWERDGKAIIYHGLYVDGVAYVGRALIDGSTPSEIRLPADWTRYGHFTVGQDETVLVTDGYYHADSGDDDKVSPWISRLDLDWTARTIRWRVLGRSDSNWDSQDSHPHPITDAAGENVYFTSNIGGRRAVYTLPTQPPQPVADVRL